MARIPYVDPAAASAKTRELLARNGERNIFRMLAHSGSHLHDYCRLGHAIRHRGELDPRLRELAIIRTGVRCGSDYEVTAHKRIGAEVGIPAEKLAAVDRLDTVAVFDETERAVLRFTDEVVLGERPSDEVFDALARTLAPAELVELHLAIGFYIMTSKFLRAFDVDPEPEA